MLQMLLATILPSRDDGRRLLSRVAAGDDRALRALYDQFGGKVLATARRILGSVGEAEEIVQETFIDVWNRADTFDAERGSVSSWILTIGRNRAIDRLRARDSRSRTAEELQSSEVPVPVPTPEQQVETAHTRHQVAAALTTLPPEQRAVVELAFYDGLSHSEIAERTGHPLGTVKGRARAALEKLSELLSKGAAS